MHLGRRTAASLIAVSLLGASMGPAAGHDHLEPRGRLVIHGTGDVTFSPNLIGRFHGGGYEEAWERLDGLFQRDHLTVINLECTPSRLGSPIEKEWNLRCDPDSLPVMAAAGVDVASLANNHAGDFGPAALLDGVERVREAGIEPVGAGRHLAEANRAAFFDIEGWRVAVVGLNTVSGRMIGEGSGGWFAGPTTPGTAPGSPANSAAAVSAAAADADIVIVTIHWGEAGTASPTAQDRVRARAMIDAGATVIFGHHPHRLQPLEIVDGVPVFWSLGNFIWPRMSVVEATTAIAEVVIESDGTVHARLIPAFIQTHGQPELRGLPDWTLRADRAHMR